MKKNIVILLAVVFVLAVGYGVFNYFSRGPGMGPTPEPEPEAEKKPKDPAANIWQDFEKMGGLASLETQALIFNWFFEKDGEIREIWIGGTGFNLKEVSLEQEESVGTYFIEQDFMPDLLNTAEGTYSSLRGYKKDDLVCLVMVGLSGYQEAGPEFALPEVETREITVKCGELKQEDEKEVKEAVCFSDEDCVPATCCHASQCVPFEQGPDCSEVICSLECQPGTMDCGAGRCVCLDGQCQVL